MPRIVDRSPLKVRAADARMEAQAGTRLGMSSRKQYAKADALTAASKARDTHAIAKKAAETRKRNGALGAGAAHVHKSRG